MRERNKAFYYTNKQMVKDLLRLTPINENDSVLDAGSGKNKVWHNLIQNIEIIVNTGEFYEADPRSGSFLFGLIPKIYFALFEFQSSDMDFGFYIRIWNLIVSLLI